MFAFSIFACALLLQIAWCKHKFNPKDWNIIGYDKIQVPYNGRGDTPGIAIDSAPPQPLPGAPTKKDDKVEDGFLTDLKAIFPDRSSTISCNQCVAAFELMHKAAHVLPPGQISDLLNKTSSVTPLFGDSGMYGQGLYLAQLFWFMNQDTGDMTALCAYKYGGVCPKPPVVKIREKDWFSPKPTKKTAKKARSLVSGNPLNVLHMSDIHLDVRYALGSEAQCSNGPCCRLSSHRALESASKHARVLRPATRWGYYDCDTPGDLPLSALAVISNANKIDFTIFTGDVVSHDGNPHVSIPYVSFEEKLVYGMFKAMMPNIPVYATLGNHDSFPEMYASYSNASSWNYDLVSSLWNSYGWIDNAAAEDVKTHYGAYAYVTPQGFKVVSINTDFWYINNVFNYANFSNPDPSGMLSFLIHELEESEKIDQRVWIIGHVPNGYSSADPLPNASALFHSIVVRFSPDTIAMIAWGHTHWDQKIIYYEFAENSMDKDGNRDTTKVNYFRPLNVGWIAPSLTPFTGLNPGYVLYQVDPDNFSVLNSQTFIANVSNAADWTKNATWEQEYDARSIYDHKGEWPTKAPLNATFWDTYLVQPFTSDSKVSSNYIQFETKGGQLEACSGQIDCAGKTKCKIQSGSSTAAQGCG